VRDIILNELLKEYKKQFDIECREFKKVEKQINSLNKNLVDYDLNYNQLKSKQNDINYFKSNLNYIIKWLETGHEPGSPYNGIDNRYTAWNKNGYLIGKGESDFE
jgi:hypothetical protein